MREVLVSFRHTNMHGIYVMTAEDWKKIKYLKKNKQAIYLGSTIDKYTSAEKFILISKDEKEIETFKKLFGKTFGSYEPFDYAMERYEELTYEQTEEDEIY